jgi:GntR family transcriptional regulator
MPASSDTGFPYHRIAADLRASILAGELAPGERLPSEWALADQYQTSRPTVRRAVAVLKSEGLVVSEQGRGLFVRPRPHVQLIITAANFRRHRSAGLPGFNAQVQEQGLRPAQRLIEVVEISAPDDVAVRLDVTPGTAVVVRRRLFLVEDEPVALCDSYYTTELARGTELAGNRLLLGGSARVIEDPTGPIRRTLARSVDELTARMPTPAEVEQLRLSGGQPIVCVHRTMYDSGGTAVEVQQTIAAADRHAFRYEVEL